jgi:16S rRNA (guanine527-N7)-methyltransferase
MGEMLQRAGIRLDQGQLDLLWRYHQLLRKHNPELNLTRIFNFESMVVKHYVDCLCVGDKVSLPSPLLDVGTGPGFPGVPLRIRYPNLKVILAEPRPERVAFLEQVRAALGFDDVEIFPHRVVSRSFQRVVPGVITRAVEVIEKTLLRTSACTDAGSRLIFMKGPNVDEELRDALRRFEGRYRLEADHAYRLPGTPHERRLIVIERLAPREDQLD